MSETTARDTIGGDLPGPGSPPQRQPGRLRLAFDAFVVRREATIFIVAVGLLLYFWANNEDFLSHNNLVNLSQQTAPYAIIATGVVLLLVCGEIDLSVGSVFVLAPFLMHYMVDFYGVYPIVAIIGSVLAGAAIGLANGLIVVVLRVPSFVATLGMLFLVLGIMLTTSHAYPAAIPEAAEGLAGWFGQADWSELIWCLIIVAFFHIVLTRSRWGLHTVATGGNPLGASEAGIRTGRIKIGNFMVTSSLGAFAGILEAFRVNSIDPSAAGADGAAPMLVAVSAAVIGGTALAGGSGTVVGALLGALVLAELRNGFNLIGISANPFNIILGLAIIISMVLNVHLTRLRRAGRR
ncbi:ABC transporter permease [Streptomyces sp. A7024]|uniref:ABC transporter permease n=1 Tax=Streptomyces coryli TaxID=1128680 RepID=A0A6G4U7G6_9ACTN|nr:ABC transporter permease [Streptomyces coryli]NGN68124.1 ABC transporter permease [Streptomyces coryli]